jgi:hypothetical protein
MREEFEFTPRYTAEEALREFAGHLRMRDYIAEMPDLTFDEERLHDTIERRKRQITRPGSVSSVGGDELTNSPLNGEEEDDE